MAGIEEERDAPGRQDIRDREDKLTGHIDIKDGGIRFDGFGQFHGRLDIVRRRNRRAAHFGDHVFQIHRDQDFIFDNQDLWRLFHVWKMARHVIRSNFDAAVHICRTRRHQHFHNCPLSDDQSNMTT